MMKKLIIITLISTFFFYSCVNQIEKENRIVQSFPFSKALYLEVGNKDESGSKEISGYILFEKESIDIHIDANNKVETCKILSVSINDNSGDIKYKTNKGIFYITLKEDVIIRVHWVSNGFSASFNRKVESKILKVKLPTPISKPTENWQRVKISNVGSIDMPPEMEIQGNEFKMITKELNSISSEKWDIEFSNPKLIFQPKGVNDGDIKSLGKYSRVMYEITIGSSGDYQKLSEGISMNSNELIELNKELRTQFMEEFKRTPNRIIDWYPIKIVKVNGMSALLISYDRQIANKPSVHVEAYKFFDYDKIYSLTLSYQISEKKLWEKKLNLILKSFRITKYN